VSNIFKTKNKNGKFATINKRNYRAP